MLTVIIVDDEIRIINLLKKLINWEELGLSLVGVASDGIDAYEIVLNLKPNILITDISMPGIDGLELVKRIKESQLDISVIMISGYKQFDYAHSALKFGVKDFIIKPINRKELNNALTRVISDRKVDITKNDYLVSMHQQLNSSKKKIRRHFLADIFHNDLSNQTIEEINKNYFFDFAPEIFMGISLRLDFLEEESENYSFILEKAKRILDDLLQDKCLEKETVIVENQLLGLLNANSNEEDFIHRQMQKYLEALKGEFQIYGNLEITLGIGRAYKQPSQMKLTLSEAQKAVLCKSVLGSEKIILAEKVNVDDQEFALKDEWLSELLTIIKTRANQEIYVWANRIFDNFVLDSSPWQIVLLYKKIVEEFKSICNDLKIIADEKLWSAWDYELSKTNSIGKLKTILVAGMIDVLIFDYEQRKARDSGPVRLAKEFIKSNIYEPITLEDIADSVSLSYGYFSRLFKEETGENISEYLTKVRMEEAKSLLRNTLLNISEISDKLGYKDARYFSKLFFKTESVRPKEYRRLYSR